MPLTPIPRRRLACLAAAALLLSGCGDDRPKTALVRGTVTYRNKPVPNGTIIFIPADGTAATGTIGRDGSYTLTTFRQGDGAILGTHKVVVMALKETDNTPAPPIVPLKYMSQTASDLRAEVQEGENTINFDLEDDKKK
jgi:hypothetical protein